MVSLINKMRASGLLAVFVCLVQLGECTYMIKILQVLDRKKNSCKRLDSPVSQQDLAQIKEPKEKLPIYSDYNPMHVV